MSNVLDTVKSDAIEAGYRIAATQSKNGVKAAILKGIELKGGDNPQLAMLGILLDSEIGDSIISLALGYSLTYTPMLKDNPKAAKLAEELRVNGFSDAGNMIVGLLTDQLKPIISKALAAIPEEETGLRVAHNEENEEVETEEEAPVQKKQARARRSG